MKSLLSLINRAVLLPTMVICTVGCAASSDIDLKPGLTLTTEEIERGQRGAHFLESTVPHYPDQPLNDYVHRILNHILSVLPDSQITFRLTILDSAELNARAFSNGQLFVDRNLLAHLSSESEVAGLLAHEVAHVVLRHERRTLKKREKFKQLVRRMGTNGATGQMQRVAGTFGEAMTQGYSRRMELEADRFAVKVLRKAGYNPAGMYNLLEILAHIHAADVVIMQRMGINPLKYTKGVFNDHPHASIRIDSIRNDLGPQTLRNGISQEDRNRYLKNIDGLVIDHYPADGLVKDGYYTDGASGIRFKMPENWSHLLIPGSGLVAWPGSREGTYLHYYALTSGAPEKDTPQPEDGSDQGLEYDPWRETGERIINGRLMRFFETRVSDDRRPVKTALVYGREAKFIFQLVNADAEASRFFQETIKSFNELTDKEVNTLDPNRISIDTLCPDGLKGPVCAKQRHWLTRNVGARRLNGYFGKRVKPTPGDLIKRIK